MRVNTSIVSFCHPLIDFLSHPNGIVSDASQKAKAFTMFFGMHLLHFNISGRNVFIAKCSALTSEGTFGFRPNKASTGLHESRGL